MNILYIHTHDTGRYIQPYGYSIPTPNLMELARNGTLFRKCFSAAPTCSPSRSAMLTGMNPHSCGMLGLAHRGFKLYKPEQHLASHLRKQGFETVLFGEQHETIPSHAVDLGYDHVYRVEKLHSTVNGEDMHEPGRIIMERDLATARLVVEYLSKPKTRPFFLSFGMNSTHRVFPPPAEDINPGYIQPPAPLPDMPEVRKDMAGFITLARCADTCVGLVLDALRQTDLENDTIILYTTDHGIAFPRMKCHLYDDGIGVSLIMKVPGIKQGVVLDALVSHLDVYPTLCELVGIDKPDWLEGRSLLPLLHGDVEEIRDEIFAEVSYHAAYEPMRCIRTKRYKYIRYYDSFEFVVKPNTDEGYSKQLLFQYGLQNRQHDHAEMLFDLVYDPNERVNLVDDPHYNDIKREMVARLSQWMGRTHDPLLRGRVPRPAGARVNLRDALQPNETEFEADLL